ncbi:hypothetical protein [Georgenia sp.]
MQFSDLLAVIRRRWLVVVLGVVLTALLGFGATRLVPIEFEAKSSILVIPPTSTPNTGGNPYLALGGLQVVADVLARAMSDPSTVEEVTPPGGAAEFVVEPDASTSGPMLVVTTTDISPEGAVELLARVVELAPEKLSVLQSSVDAPPQTQLEIAVIAQDTEALPLYKGLIRALLVVVAAGLGLTAALTVAIDSLRRRRAEATPPREEVGDHADAGAPEERVFSSPDVSAGAVPAEQFRGRRTPARQA